MCVCVRVCVIWSGLLITYGRVCVRVDLVWIAMYGSVQMCVCVDLVWVADKVWESASVCACGFGLGC